MMDVVVPFSWLVPAPFVLIAIGLRLTSRRR